MSWHQILSLGETAVKWLAFVVGGFFSLGVLEYLLLTRCSRAVVWVADRRRMAAARGIAFLVTCVMAPVRLVGGRKVIDDLADRLAGGDGDA